MNHADLESTYELLATNIDKFDESTAPVFLAKLALLMASEIDDMVIVQRCIQVASAHLDNG